MPFFVGRQVAKRGVNHAILSAFYLTTAYVSIVSQVVGIKLPDVTAPLFADENKIASCFIKN